MSTLLTKNFYGDQQRWFMGVVEDNKDPVQLGRLKVRIRGLHSANMSDIDTSDLPWAQVGLPTTEGGISGIGRSTGILPGAEVVGFFLDGSGSQLPFITHVIPKLEYGDLAFPDGRLTRGGQQSGGQGHGSSGQKNGIVPEGDVAVGAVGGTNAETAYNFFLANGFTPNQAAGIVGNLMVESGPSLNTSIKSAGSERSFGIAQWNSAAAAGNRFGNLQNFATDLGRDWTELGVQLKFILHELYTVPYNGLGALQASQTIDQAVEAFCYKFERPGTPHLAKRKQYAYDIYKRMN